MSQQIDIPDVGLVEFPDGMSDEDITTAIQKNIIPQYTPAPKSAGDYVKDFGRGLASAVDTGANMVTGLGSYVGYPFGRAFGLNPQEATAAANRVGAPLQNPVGRTFGIENDPAYQNSAANKIVGGIGQGISSVAQPISNATGLPQQDVEHMIGTALIAAGPAIPKVAGAVGRGASAIGEGVKNVGGAASDVAQGAYRGFTNTAVRPGVTPKPWQTPSARQPIGDTYVTPESLQAWRAGEIPASDLTHRPTTDLPVNALKQTQGMVPYQGQQYQALGEHIGTAYRDPKKLIAEALLDVPTGGFASAVRGGAHAIEAYKNYQAFNKLNQAGFTPITQAEHAAMKTGGMHPDLPNTTMNTAPVAPTAAPITPPPTAAPITPPVAPVAPTTPNYQVPAYQRTNATIPGINAPVAPTTPPVGQLSPPTTPAQVQGANFIGNTEKKFGLTPVAPAELPPPPATAAPVTTAEGPIAPEGMPAPVAETPKPLPTPAEAAIIAQKAKPVKATNLPTTEHGKVPVTGNDYYEHYIKGGLTPNELKYSPGTLAEQLYQKVKTDPASLTKEDIQNWYRYDHMEKSTPDFKVSKPTKKNPTPPTEADLVALASKNIAKNLIENYERVQAKTPRGRPELVGKTVEEAKAFDAKRMQDAENKRIADQLKEDAEKEAKQPQKKL